MIYRNSKKSGSHREINNVKNIKSKASKKNHGDSIDSYSDKSYSDSSLSIKSNWYEGI